MKYLLINKTTGKAYIEDIEIKDTEMAIAILDNSDAFRTHDGKTVEMWAMSDLTAQALQDASK